MKVSIICCALMSAVLLSSIDLSASECCHVPLKCTESGKSVERCYDCTEATVYCGKGQCNILGCNCDGGCRQGDSTLWCWNISSGCKGKYFLDFISGKESVFTSQVFTAEQLLNAYDSNSDEKLSLHETTKYILRSGLKNVDIESEFKKMDANGDGFLTLNEIDN